MAYESCSLLSACPALIHSLSGQTDPEPQFCSGHASRQKSTNEQVQRIKLEWQEHRDWWEMPDPDWEGDGNQGTLPGGGAMHTKT